MYSTPINLNIVNYEAERLCLSWQLSIAERFHFNVLQIQATSHLKVESVKVTIPNHTSLNLTMLGCLRDL